MKSAREHADHLWSTLPDVVQRAIDLNYRSGERAFRNYVTSLLQEHARDQRRLCASAINDADYSHGAPVDTAHFAAMNAPAPGEKS